MQGLEEGTFLFYKVYHILFGNAFAVDAYSLAEIYQVWRGVESYFVSLCLKDGSNGV